MTGTYALTRHLPVTDALRVAGVPRGTYTLRLYAENAGAVSAPTPPIALTFPGPCTGAPLAPSRFLAYRLGRTVFVVWDPAATGPAPTGYVLGVTGTTFVGEFAVAARGLSGTVGPGTYDLSVLAYTPCGQSAATPVQRVVVP